MPKFHMKPNPHVRCHICYRAYPIMDGALLDNQHKFRLCDNCLIRGTYMVCEEDEGLPNEEYFEKVVGYARLRATDVEKVANVLKYGPMDADEK